MNISQKNTTHIASLLASAAQAEQISLLENCSAESLLPLAVELRKLCYEAWMTAPEKTARIVLASYLIAEKSKNKEVAAIADWISGIGCLTEGRMKQAIAYLEKAEKKFRELDKPLEAAETQISKMYALAVLGRYDDALDCGLEARQVFLAAGEFASAGKVEHNLGNIFQRQDRYLEAEEILRLAKTRFSSETDQNKIIQIENSLANALSHQNRFRESEAIYEEALHRATQAGLEVTQAELESNLGYLSLFQGRYDRALNLFESSRRRYFAMKMPHQTAIAEQEIADVYLELNLIPEAQKLYQKVIPTFKDLKMNAEYARALVFYAKSLTQNGQVSEVPNLLAESHRIYRNEKNSVGEAIVALAEAQMFFAENEFEKAEKFAHEAEKILQRSDAWSRALQARILRGNAARNLGKTADARYLLETARNEAEVHFIPQVRLSCLVSLGLLAVDEKDFATAERFFIEAIELTEKLRAPLPAEDFRTAFVTDKLTSYREIVKIYLEKGEIEKAFQFSERSRSRALLDALGGDFAGFEARDEYEKSLLEQQEKLREELNWFYHQSGNSLKTMQSKFSGINEAIRDLESEMSEIVRQLSSRLSPNFPDNFQPMEFSEIQKILDENTALIEFSSLDGEFFAFVLTGENVSVVKNLASEKEISELLGQFRFQINLMRSFGDKTDESIYRTRHILSVLYTKLLKPLEKFIGFRRLVIVPHQDLNYIPFHALFDGFGYAIENREIIYAPSAGVLVHCLKKPLIDFKNILLFGAANQKNPQVRGEVLTLAQIFPDSESFLDEEATRKTLFEKAQKANILHLACHGQFRSDNPLFSSLQIGNGFLTVRDAYNLRLENCGLAVLSACETGISKIAKGEEMLGLIRGFLSAGAPCLILSLWKVEDESTAELMKIFYQNLKKNQSVSAALRLAQCDMLKKYPHPFFWSPFFVVGRW